MSSPTPDPNSRKLADLMLEFDRRLARMESGTRAAQLGYSSVEDSYIEAYDSLGQARQRIGRQTDGTFSIIYSNGTAPPVPDGVNIAAGQLALVVQWDGSFVGGVDRPADFLRLDIHMSETEGYTPDSTTIRASIFDVGAVSFFADSDTKYIRAVAVSNAGVPSAPTDELAILPLPADQIAAGAIGAQQLAAEIVLANKIIVGNPTAARFVLDGTTNEVSGYKSDGSTRTLLFDADTGDVFIVGEYRTAETGDTLIFNKDSVFPMTIVWEFNGGTKRSEITSAVDGSGNPTTVIYTANSDDSVSEGTRIIQSYVDGAHMDYVTSGAADTTSTISVHQNYTMDKSRVNYQYASEEYGSGTAANLFGILDSGGLEYTHARLEHIKMYSDPTRQLLRNAQADLGIMWNSLPSPSELMILNGNASAFRPVRASGYLTGSSRRGKQNVEKITFSGLEVIAGVSIMSWEYRPSEAYKAETRNEMGRPTEIDIPAEIPKKHIGPMAEELPEHLVVDSGGENSDKAVDLRDMVFVSWKAIQELNDTVKELREQLEELTSRVVFLEVQLEQ